MTRFREWREARRNKKREKKWVANHPEAMKFPFGTDITYAGFDPRGPGAGAALDDDSPSVHIIPSYYEYDQDGEATGEVKS